MFRQIRQERKEKAAERLGEKHALGILLSYDDIGRLDVGGSDIIKKALTFFRIFHRSRRGHENTIFVQVIFEF